MKKLLLSLFFLAGALPADAQETVIPYNSCGTTLISNCVLKPAPGLLFSVNAAMLSGTVWVALLDTATTPSNGTVQAVKWFGPFSTPNYLEFSYNTSPLQFTTGIAIACSTGIPPTLTLTAQCLISGGTR